MVFEYRANPIEWLGQLGEAVYKRAHFPCRCGRCGGVAGSRVVRETTIPIEAGNFMRMNTRTARLCGQCFDIVAAEKRKENAHTAHDISGDRLAYIEIVKRESGGNDYREHWQMG